MDDVKAVFHDLERRANELGVSMKPPLRSTDLAAWAADAQSALKFDVPAGYLTLLGLSNGLATQRGYLYEAEIFVEQNYVRWYCETRGRVTPEGYVVEYIPLADPPTPEYALLGAYGNMDEYVFDFASAEYRVTQLGSADQVWFSSPTLGGLLQYVTETET